MYPPKRCTMFLHSLRIMFPATSAIYSSLIPAFYKFPVLQLSLFYLRNFPITNFSSPIENLRYCGKFISSIEMKIPERLCEGTFQDILEVLVDLSTPLVRGFSCRASAVMARRLPCIDRTDPRFATEKAI